MSRAIPFAVAVPLLSCAVAPATEIIAHRGASNDAPENTLSALQLGWEQGADANELDVQLTQDGHIVLLHDKTTRRTTGLDQPVAGLTLDQVQALDAGTWKGDAWKGEQIPTLNQALKILPDDKRLIIEIKCGPEILPQLEKDLNNSGRNPNQAVIIGFSWETMRRAKRLLPEHEVYWLVSPKKESQGLLPTVEELIAWAKEANLDGLNLSHHFAIDREFTAKIHDSGLKLYVWTVNDARQATHLVESGVDGITTDKPGWLREQLSQEPQLQAVQTDVLPAPEAIQAAAAEGGSVYAINNTVVARYDRSSGQRLGLSTGSASHLNSGFFWKGSLYCAHSNFPKRPATSEIMVLDPASMQLSVYKRFGDDRGSLTWVVRQGDSWWCNFAHYGEGNNARTVLVKLDPDWNEQGAWRYPAEVVRELGQHSISGGSLKDGEVWATGHDRKVIYRLQIPEPGEVLKLVDIIPSPFPGQGIAHDPETGGLIGINRARKQVVFARLQVAD